MHCKTIMKSEADFSYNTLSRHVLQLYLVHICMNADSILNKLQNFTE